MPAVSLPGRSRRTSFPDFGNRPASRDELTLLNPNGKDAIAISLWDRKENADAYTRDVYPQVLKDLVAVVEGTPAVQAYEVSNSTFHKIAAHN